MCTAHQIKEEVWSNVVFMVEMRCVCRILVRGSERKNPFGRSKQGWEDNTALRE
jgi:hypothetical protein